MPEHSLSTAEFLPCLVVFHWLLLQSGRLQTRRVYVLRRRHVNLRWQVERVPRCKFKRNIYFPCHSLCFLFVSLFNWTTCSQYDAHWMIYVVDVGLFCPTLTLLPTTRVIKKWKWVWACLNSSFTLHLCREHTATPTSVGSKVQACCKILLENKCTSTTSKMYSVLMMLFRWLNSGAQSYWKVILCTLVIYLVRQNFRGSGYHSQWCHVAELSTPTGLINHTNGNTCMRAFHFSYKVISKQIMRFCIYNISPLKFSGVEV